jgi:hypothetical protein
LLPLFRFLFFLLFLLLFIWVVGVEPVLSLAVFVVFFSAFPGGVRDAITFVSSTAVDVTADEADAGLVFLLTGDEELESAVLVIDAAADVSDGGFFFIVAATNLRIWSKSCRNGFDLGSTVPLRTRPLIYRIVASINATPARACAARNGGADGCVAAWSNGPMCRS